MNNYLLETKDVVYTYPDRTQALKNICIKIEKGKTTAILGGNGAGKTTLFLHLNGILKPTAGEILYKGQPIDYSKKGLMALRKAVGLVFQDPDNQLFSASVYQDISFGPMNLKIPEEEVRTRVESSLKRAGIYELKDRPTHSLSFGQKKRAAIAGILAMQPEVIVLDEPTAGLDPKGVAELLKLLKEMQKESDLAVVIATHDIDIVPLYCHYVYVIEQGETILQGTPFEVFAETNLLRKAQLRLPRVGHLMEILQEKDGFRREGTITTISQARKVIKKWRDEV